MYLSSWIIWALWSWTWMERWVGYRIGTRWRILRRRTRWGLFRSGIGKGWTLWRRRMSRSRRRSERSVMCKRGFGKLYWWSNFASNSMQILLVHLDVHVWIEGYIWREVRACFSASSRPARLLHHLGKDCSEARKRPLIAHRYSKQSAIFVVLEVNINSENKIHYRN